MNTHSVKTRLFVNASLSAGITLSIDGPQHHFLKNVLRTTADDQIAFFNGKDGEWLATVTAVDKKAITLKINQQTQEQKSLTSLTLAFALVKKNPLDLIIQKATELGVTSLVPLITDRTVVQKLNLDRLQDIAIEASEQSKRICLPTIVTPKKLEAYLKDLAKNATLYFADESLSGAPATTVFTPSDHPILLIGPEGGFTDNERSMIKKLSQAKSFTLGPRILKAETAAISTLTLYQGLCGDWSH